MARTSNDDATTRLAEQLGSVDLFSALNRKQRQWLAGMFRAHTFGPGTTIVEQGEESGRFYLITEGTADVVVNGKRVGSMGPGTSFGEVSVIDKGARSATVIASTTVVAQSLASLTLRPLLKEQPDVMFQLLLKLCGMLRNADPSRD
jgi:CRP-like cAMP-binding protein